MKQIIVLMALLGAGQGELPAESGAILPDGAGRILLIDKSSMPVAAGQATLTIGALQRVGGVYVGEYKLNVSPYFFKNEKGALAITVSDQSMAEIAQGKVTAIVGTATTSGRNGVSRHVDATATPTDTNHGTLKLWFAAGDRKMIFEPNYHFAGTGTAPGLADPAGTNVNLSGRSSVPRREAGKNAVKNP
jgi:hypothetical protein